MEEVSIARLPLSSHNPLITRQFFQPQRSAGVQFLGADADLRAQTELSAVSKSCGSVAIYRSGVNLNKKFFSNFFITGNNRFAVFGTMPIDKLYCLFG